MQSPRRMMATALLTIVLMGAVSMAGEVAIKPTPAAGKSSAERLPLKPRMYFADTISGQPFSKDPAVVKFKGRYWLYYSLPPYTGKPTQGWNIGVATSQNLLDWKKVGALANTGEVEKQGFCAPGAIVLGGKVHLFYQTYGNGPKDAICHAWSDDGLCFHRNPTNPIFRPQGDWNCGRAIDADVIAHKGRLLMYWATRDPTFKVQMQGVAAASLECDFARDKWTQLNLVGPVLKPQLPWEGQCIEAAAMAEHSGRLYMFYAGNYNNRPQQIGVAVSDDGVRFTRLFDKPFLPNGPPGSWNASESGHPFLFRDDDNQHYLFYQGNNDRGQTWHLSVVPVDWKDGKPILAAKAPAACRALDGTFWTTGDRLLPAWGFYRNGSAYSGTSPSGAGSAWTCSGGTHVLTWVAEFPVRGKYHAWVRQYGGYGKVGLTVDGRPPSDPRSGPGGAKYVWRHLGALDVEHAQHHIDVTVQAGMVDAVLFTLDGQFQPETAKLPPPVEEPRLRGLRTYRDDSHLAASAGPHGFVTGAVRPYEEVRYDWLPRPKELVERIRLWGAAGQYVSGSFAVRALRPIAGMRVELDRLDGPHGTWLGPDAIDLRVVHLRRRNLVMPATRTSVEEFPDLLLRDDRTGLPPKGPQGGYGGGMCVTGIPAHQARQFWLTLHVPRGSKPGIWRGRIRLVAGEGRKPYKELPVELEVLDLDLRPVEGYYSIYYPNQPVKRDRASFVSPKRFAAELADQVRHGLNSTTLYGGFETLEAAARAGMTRAPCIMGWPGGNAPDQIRRAKELGFDGLLYYGVDEPRTPQQIERCLKESARRQKLGLPMMAAINSRSAWEALRDAVSHPVYNIKVFDSPGNEQVKYARSKGFQPVSYWAAAPAFPLYYRLMSGLYNTACGYLGSAPWAYQDFPDDRLYTTPAHAMAYPDASGLPIPTLRWEAFRDGIDDVRYLQILDRAIAATEARLQRPQPDTKLAAALAQARRVRAEQYESISGRWFQYTFRQQPGDPDRVRRAMAEAACALMAAK